MRTYKGSSSFHHFDVLHCAHVDQVKQKGWFCQRESLCHGQEMSFITHVGLHPASSAHVLNLTCDAGKVKQRLNCLAELMMSSHECLDGGNSLTERSAHPRPIQSPHMSISAVKHQWGDGKAICSEPPLALQRRQQQYQKQLDHSMPSLTEYCSVFTSTHTFFTTSQPWFTYTSASGGRDLEALRTQAYEASLGVGAGSKGADLRQLGALVNIWHTERKDVNISQKPYQNLYHHNFVSLGLMCFQHWYH